MTDDSVLPWGRDWPRISRSGSTILGPTWYLVCCIRISATTFVDVVVMSINQLDASTTVTTATTTTMVVPYMSQYHYVQPDDALRDEMRKVGKFGVVFMVAMPCSHCCASRSRSVRNVRTCACHVDTAWKGRRGDLLPHEEKDCALAKVLGLVDQCRLMRMQLDLVLALGHA